MVERLIADFTARHRQYHRMNTTAKNDRQKAKQLELDLQKLSQDFVKAEKEISQNYQVLINAFDFFSSSNSNPIFRRCF